MQCVTHTGHSITFNMFLHFVTRDFSLFEENVRLDQVRCAGAHPHSQAFKPARVNPIKLAYDTRQPDGRPHSDQRL